MWCVRRGGEQRVDASAPAVRRTDEIGPDTEAWSRPFNGHHSRGEAQRLEHRRVEKQERASRRAGVCQIELSQLKRRLRPRAASGAKTRGTADAEPAAVDSVADDFRNGRFEKPADGPARWEIVECSPGECRVDARSSDSRNRLCAKRRTGAEEHHGDEDGEGHADPLPDIDVHG